MGSLLLWFNKFISNSLVLTFAFTTYFLCVLGQLLNSFKPGFATHKVRHLEQMIHSFYQLCSLPDNLRILICWILVMKS